jgi:hypothetical protein
VALVEDLAARTHVIGTLDTLDNLKKGGRIGGAQALLGSLLSIKPVVDISTGVVEEAGKARTRRRPSRPSGTSSSSTPDAEHVCVTHGLAPDVDDMLALVTERYPRDQIRIGHIGPVIGTHGGPRVMGVTWVEIPTGWRCCCGRRRLTGRLRSDPALTLLAAPAGGAAVTPRGLAPYVRVPARVRLVVEPLPQRARCRTEPGHLLAGRYRIEEKLASGGMAQVWKATDEVLRRGVAIKILHPHLAADDTFVTRFRQEAVAAARLAHPGIVSIFDTCSDDGLEAIVMELLRGRTLRDRLDADEPLDPWQAAGWPPRSPTPSTPPTVPAWSTATSSPPTSSWPATAG